MINGVVMTVSRGGGDHGEIAEPPSLLTYTQHHRYE